MIFFSEQQEGDDSIRSEEPVGTSLALMMKRQMKEKHQEGRRGEGELGGKHREHRQGSLLYAACGRGRPAAREKITIDAAIVHRWSKLLRDASSHERDPADGRCVVGARVSIRARVARARADVVVGDGRGPTKRVAVRDTPKAAMELFLEIVYTGA